MDVAVTSVGITDASAGKKTPAKFWLGCALLFVGSLTCVGLAYNILYWRSNEQEANDWFTLVFSPLNPIALGLVVVGLKNLGERPGFRSALRILSLLIMAEVLLAWVAYPIGLLTDTGGAKSRNSPYFVFVMTVDFAIGLSFFFASSRLLKRRRTTNWFTVAMLIVAVIVCIWFVINNAGRWKDRFVPRKLRTIDAGQLFASGQIDRHLIRSVLSEDKIKVIVCLQSDVPTDPDVAAELRAAKSLGIDRFVDPLSGDGTGDFRAYANAVAQMAEARKEGKPVLVHCNSGAQRSNGATYLYRVLIEHWDADAAAQEMIRNGHNPKENPALIPYLNSHIRDIAATLVTLGVIDHIPEPLPQIHHD